MKKTRLIFCIAFILCMIIGSNCYAAWWGTPGYEWALTQGLTSIKTQAQLNREVTVSDYYSVILKYLKLKNVAPKNKIVQEIYTNDIYSGTIRGLVKDVNGHIGSNKKDISPEEYRVVESLTEHGKTIAAQQADVITRDDLKTLNLYLDLAKYRAAMLLQEDTKIKREYKNSVLYSLRNTKYAESLKYGIMPMCGNISRGSFLTLMYNLLSTNTSDQNSIVESFYDSDVLEGYEEYDRVLKLDQNITYAEMLNLLYRFEAYDFE